MKLKRILIVLLLVVFWIPFCGIATETNIQKEKCTTDEEFRQLNINYMRSNLNAAFDQKRSTERQAVAAEIQAKVAQEQTIAAERQMYAAWLQALGSIAAVFVAIWVMNRQHQAQVKRDKDREKADERNMLLALQAELQAFYDETIIGGMGQRVTVIKDGMPFEDAVRTDENPFHIYPACARDIGKIQNELLQKEIIATYSCAFEMIQVFIINSDIYINGKGKVESQHLKFVVQKAKERIEKLLEMLKQYTEVNHSSDSMK